MTESITYQELMKLYEQMNQGSRSPQFHRPLLKAMDSYENFGGTLLTQYEREKWYLGAALREARSNLVAEILNQDRYKAFDKKRQYVSEKSMQHNLKILREAVKKAQQDLDVLEVRKLLHNW